MSVAWCAERVRCGGLQGCDQPPSDFRGGSACGPVRERVARGGTRRPRGIQGPGGTGGAVKRLRGWSA
jgi:hypothetical protein